ncbi:mycothiol transferase [Dietzia sp.]|uniref:mycothiol transferase n=1 Tax=Dietzia sp. TaxID=1871616 RepID=UPI002FD90E06
MDAKDLLVDIANRPAASARSLPSLTAEQLAARPDGHPNSIAWLLWHSGREADVQLSALSGEDEVWGAYRERFGLGAIGDTMGYGHTPEQAAQIEVGDQDLLVSYLEAVMKAVVAYSTTLSESDLDVIVDESWDPPVSRGVRLVSLIEDAAIHVGQAAYVAGALTA